jgi:hypothetical protein
MIPACKNLSLRNEKQESYEQRCATTIWHKKSGPCTKNINDLKLLNVYLHEQISSLDPSCILIRL